MAETLVAPLRAFGRDDLALAGGKGANLGELVRAGFPVPDGFVVTTRAYDQAASELDPQLFDAAATSGDGSVVREAFATVAIPTELRTAISRAYEELGGGLVAVRSSATAEDLPGAAFAGLQDTVLNVVGEEALVDAVRRCWGSLWTDRAIAYRHKRDLDSAVVRMAVVVQRMVPAETAGVLFTANPVSGERGEIVVDASSGLGEAVVSGAVTPDHYVLDAEGRLKRWTPGRREVVIRALPEGGVQRVEGEASADPTPLPAAVLGELAGLGTRIGAHFGRPQDIEWAHADGRVWVLQARPMTALPPPPIPLSSVQRTLGRTLLEYVPVRPYPLDMSTWVPYGPVGQMARIVRSLGFRIGPSDVFQEEDGVVVRLVPVSPRPTFDLVAAPFRLARRALGYDPQRWMDDPRVTRLLKENDALTKLDLAALPWRRLIEIPREALALVEPVADLRLDYIPRVGLSIVRLLALLVALRRTKLIGDLLLGVFNKTSESIRALRELADEVRTDPVLAEAFATREPAALVEALNEDPAFARFGEKFRAFLAEYGHRETETPVLMSPGTWEEAPETVLGLIKVLAQRGADEDDLVDGLGNAAERYQRAVEETLAHPRLRSDSSRARVRRWIEAARVGLAFREDTHFYFTKPLPVLRRSLLEIGRRLSEAGVLREAEDVFHLRLEELEAIRTMPPPASDAERLRALVRARSAKRDELAGVPLLNPMLVYGDSAPDGDALVTGLPAVSGRVTGTVKVVRGPSEFGKLEPGDVLVCPYTNPAWTPLFQRAAAVVVDTGGPTSHAAIIAREYGLPTVMGTRNGTTVLRDGQRVTVDGHAGRVTPAAAKEPASAA